MKLTSAYLFSKLMENYQITGQGNISGEEMFLRPVFRDCENIQKHVVVTDEILETDIWDACLLILVTGETGLELPAHVSYIALCTEESLWEVRNSIQKWYDEADAWQERMKDMLLEEATLDEILGIASEFMGNPLTVIGPDYSLIAEAGTKNIPDNTRIFHDDSMNSSYMSMLIQYKKINQETTAPMLYPAFIGGVPSISMNLQIGEFFFHRLVVTEVNEWGQYADYGILTELAKYVTFILEHTPAILENNMLEDVFQILLTDKTADYMQISKKLSQLGWGMKHTYFCLVFQIPYQSQDGMTTQGICKYMRKEYAESCSFAYDGFVVTYFNLTLLNMEAEEIEQKLSLFIRDSYLKAGYSRCIRGHMNLRRQYIQAKTAIEVGSRAKPYIWIYRFNQIVLPYIMEQSVRRLPADMLCHEGILELKKIDDEHNSEYLETLKVYLANNLSATKSANELFIHRSTFLYRLEKIREVLQSQIEDPDEIFYLNYSLRILEMEK